MGQAVELTSDERAHIEALRDEIGPAHPYVVDGFRAQIGGKVDVKVERQRIARARDAWVSLDPVTQDYVRWMAAGRVIELLGQSSNKAVAAAVRGSSEEEIARLTGELSEGARFEDRGDGFEERPGPLDLPPMLEEAENALRLPSGRAEELPNLRRVVEALWVFWRRDVPVRAPKVTAEAVEAIAGEIVSMYRLSPEEARRRVNVALRELDALDRLPLR